MRRNGFAGPAGIVRAARPASGGAGLSRRAAWTGSLSGRSCGLHRQSPAGHAHGRTAARLELHGICPARGVGGPTQSNATAADAARARPYLRARGTLLDGCPSRPAGLPAGNRPRHRTGQTFLRDRPSAHRAHHGSRHRRVDRRPGGGSSPAARGRGIRPATLRRAHAMMRRHHFKVTFMHSFAPWVMAAVWVTVLGLSPGRSEAAAADAADARLASIYTAEWKWREQQLPDNEDTRRPIQDHLPKTDPASQALRLRMWLDVLRKLDAIPVAELSPAEQLNYAIYRPQIETLIASQQFRDYEMPANADTTFWTDLGYTARRPFRTAQDYRSWIAQMKDIPRYFREQTDEMRRGLKRGFTPPQVTMKGRDASITAVTEASPEASLFYTPFKDMPGIPPADQSSLRAQAISVIRDAVQPAYRELLKFMRTEYLPGTRTTLAAYDLPDGRNFYRAKIREFTTLDQDPAAIHAFGESEVERLHAQMLAVMKETGFGGDFPAFLTFLRTDPRFQAKTPEELLMRAA